MTEKIEAFWSNATVEDVAVIANTRKPIPARVRDEETEDWLDCPIAGWKLSKHLPGAKWIDADGAMWNQCQVYSEPSWYAKKPDPGEGFRLLGKFPDEAVMGGDFVCNYYEEWTEMSPGCNPTQFASLWYRRRIGAAKPTQQFDRRVSLQVGDRVRHPSGFLVVVTEKGFEVSQ